jgi:hypothetical protein
MQTRKLIFCKNKFVTLFLITLKKQYFRKIIFIIASLNNKYHNKILLFINIFPCIIKSKFATLTLYEYKTQAPALFNNIY